VSDVKLAGQMLAPEAELKALITLEPGAIFVRDRLTETTKKIGDRLGNDGYAFANVNAVPEFDKDKNTVAFTLFIDPGRRVYVNRINVAGNTKTRDEVVRREMRQMEGAYYDAEKINRSRDRLNRLGFFNEVNVETPSVTGTTDQVDVNVSLEEKSTGNVQLGAGFSSNEGLVISGSVSQSNVFGTGNFVSVQLNSGSANTVYSLSFTNPYYTLDGISLGYDVFRRDVDSTSLDNVGDYKTSTYGLGARFGLPVNERDFISFGATYEQTSITTSTGSPANILSYVSTFGNDTDTVRLDAAWARNTRNSALFPTSGMLQRVSAEVGTPLGSLEYYKLSFQHQQYFPIGKRYTLMLNGEIGIGNGLAGKPLPFFKNFYAGGNSSVRGFETSTLGPKDANDDSIGGDQRIVGNAEFFFPFPGLKDDQFRMSAFLDAGATFGPFDAQGRFGSFAFDDLRYSAGLAVLWVSPLGPLKFSLAQPLVSKDGDKEEIFQFALGNSF
jgi:outer membrane protein insertion porin family